MDHYMVVINADPSLKVIVISDLKKIEKNRIWNCHVVILYIHFSISYNSLSTDIKENLGIVICLDKNQENLSDLMEKYPLLYNDGTIVWLEHWTDDTLRQWPRLLVQR